MTKISKNFTHFSETKFVDSKCGGGCESCESNANPTDSSESRESYAQFTADMKATHTILVPTMLPIHFRFMVNLLHSYGYKAELLENANKAVVDEGLRNVHNDTCYPALLVIGQLIDALKSGKYDLNKVALLITQTGGGCRASNYIYLLRKALKKKRIRPYPCGVNKFQRI